MAGPSRRAVCARCRGTGREAGDDCTHGGAAYGRWPDGCRRARSWPGGARGRSHRYAGAALGGGEPAKLVRRLAKLLPEDVRVHGCEFAPAGFDARFSALRRHYVYRITTNPRGALPTRARDTAEWIKPVDIDAMQDAATALVGLHDFAAFVKPSQMPRPSGNCRNFLGATFLRPKNRSF